MPAGKVDLRAAWKKIMTTPILTTVNRRCLFFFSDKIETDSRKSHLLELIGHGILISFYFTSIVKEEERGRESYTFKEVLIARSNFRKFRKFLVILRILISAKFLAKTNSRKLILAKNTK